MNTPIILPPIAPTAMLGMNRPTGSPPSHPTHTLPYTHPMYLHSHLFHEYTHHSASNCTHCHAGNKQTNWKPSLPPSHPTHTLPYTHPMYLHCHLFHEYTHHSASNCTHCHAGNKQTSWNLKYTISISISQE